MFSSPCCADVAVAFFKMTDVLSMLLLHKLVSSHTASLYSLPFIFAYSPPIRTEHAACPILCKTHSFAFIIRTELLSRCFPLALSSRYSCFIVVMFEARTDCFSDRLHHNTAAYLLLKNTSTLIAVAFIYKSFPPSPIELERLSYYS